MTRELYKDLDEGFIQEQASLFNELDEKENFFTSKKFYLLLFSGSIIFLSILSNFIPLDSPDNKVVRGASDLWQRVIMIPIVIFLYRHFVKHRKRKQVLDLIKFSRRRDKGQEEQERKEGDKEKEEQDEKEKEKEKDRNKEKIKEKVIRIMSAFMWLISPDYVYSNESKKQLENNIHCLNINQIYKPSFFSFNPKLKKRFRIING